MYMYMHVYVHVHVDDTLQIFTAAVVVLTENEFIFLGIVEYLIEPHHVGVVQLLQDGYLSSDIIKRTFLFNLLHWSTTCVRGGGGSESLSLSLSLAHKQPLSLFLYDQFHNNNRPNIWTI